MRKSTTETLLFNLQYNASQHRESENERVGVGFLESEYGKVRVCRGRGVSRAEVLHWVMYNGDRAERRMGHIKTGFSERASLMLPNPQLVRLTKRTHIHTVVLRWHLFMTVGQWCVRGVAVCVADVTCGPGR